MKELNELIKDLKLQMNYCCYDAEMLNKLSGVWEVVYKLVDLSQNLQQCNVSGALPPDEKFFELTEKICYQQFAADPMGDIVAKMSLIKQFINEQCLCGNDR